MPTLLRRRGVLGYLTFLPATLLFLLLCSCGSQNGGQTTSNVLTQCTGATNNAECRAVTVNGVSRYYLLYVPANFQANLSGLVVALHGSGGTGADMEQGTGMNTKANEAGFAVAYPYGLVAPGVGITEWHNYFDDSIWASNPPDDVSFMRALVSAVEAEVHPDPRRIYFTGISNGGLFAHKVGIEMSDVVAAVGIVEGTLYGFNGNVQGIPPAKASVSVLIFHGDADNVIPYCAQQGVASQEITFNYWTQTPANQCSTLDSSMPLCSGGSLSTLNEKDGAGCSGGAEVRFYRLLGGVHEWYEVPMNIAGQVPYNPNLNSSTGVTTDDILWNFFAAHPKP